MAALLHKGPDELQRWVAELGTRLIAPMLQPLLPPLAGVRLQRPYPVVADLLAPGAVPRDDEDVLALFELARVGIRVAHVVTSPWYFMFTRDVARRARWASRILASRQQPAPGAAESARQDFALLCSTLLDRSEGFSVRDILDTHAMVGGLQASMARPAPLELFHLALEFYHESPDSLRLLSRMAEEHGIQNAVLLAPRLCAAALRFPYPAIALADLLQSITQRRDRVGDLLALSGPRFFLACRLDPDTAAMSSRQLRVERREASLAERRTTSSDDSAGGRAARGAGADVLRQTDQSMLDSRGWGDTLRPYFDGFEALPDIDARLQACIDPMQADAAPSASGLDPLFRPLWSIHADGSVGKLRGKPTANDLADFARWVTLSLEMLDGLAWLNDAAPPPPHGQS